MPSNDERREVAARLRKCIIFAKECDQHNEGEMIRENGNVMFRDIAEAVGGDYANFIDSYEETLTKLADLIEPDERTCQMELCDTGEWFTPECREEYLFCSNCKFVGYYVQVNEDADYWCAKPNYCPNCGARVKEEE